MRYFLLLGTLLAILQIAIFKPNTVLIALIRSFSWYFFIGLLAVCIYKIAKDKSRLFVIAAWFAGFAAVYIIMTFMNVYIFNLLKTNDDYPILFYILQSIKIGGIIGIGIGLGKIVTDFLFQNDLNMSGT